jgi:hypothetical protein
MLILLLLQLVLDQFVQQQLKVLEVVRNFDVSFQQ